MGPVGRVIICVPHWHEDDLVRSAPRLQRRGSAQVDRRSSAGFAGWPYCCCICIRCIDAACHGNAIKSRHCK
jgi:hypothetical protein